MSDIKKLWETDPIWISTKTKESRIPLPNYFPISSNWIYSKKYVNPSEWKMSLLVDGFMHNINRNLQQKIPYQLNEIFFAYFYIEPIPILKQKRIEAIRQNKTEKILEIEQLIVLEICYLNSTDYQINQNKELFVEILNSWNKQQKMDCFRNEIIESIMKCIQNDNICILNKMLSHCGYRHFHDIDKTRKLPRNDEYIDFINIAAKYGSFECISLFLKYPHRLNWTKQKKPICLLNAVKFQHNNLKLINFIMDKLESVDTIFECSDIMKKVIDFDIVDIAERLIADKWYEITEEDQLKAKLLGLRCYQLFNKKMDAFKYFNDNQGNGIINLDDDEWDNHNDQNDDFDDDDNDWQNAED